MIAESTIMKSIIKKTQQYLFAIALFIIGLSVAMGAWWGLVADWNPDQLAFGRLDTSYTLPKPNTYIRPPLVSYFHWYFSALPILRIGDLVRAPQNLISLVMLTWSKTLTAGIYVLSIVIFSRIVKKFIRNTTSVGMLSLLFGSSAGLIAYAHFLTADIPLMFGMICSLLFIVNALLNPTIINFVLAGILCGLTVAVKYNGFILIIPLVFTYALSVFTHRKVKNALEIVHDARNKFSAVSTGAYVLLGFVLLLVFVVIGFLLGNPYAVSDFHTFYSNVLYILETNKYASGSNLFIGYPLIVPVIVELIGKPATIIIGGLTAGSCLALIFSGKTRRAASAFFFLNVLLVVPYIIFMANSSLLPARYVLPIVPSLFFLTVPFFSFIDQNRKALCATLVILACIVLYNFVCVYQIDMRFIFDPRMGAYAWSNIHIPEHATIETTQYAPNLNAAFDKHLTVTFIPYVKERSVSFKKLFANNSVVREQINQFDGAFDDMWFTIDNLYARAADYLLLNSWQYNDSHPSYVIATAFYDKLLHNATKYRIVFDQVTQPMPSWSYPQDVDFLFNRMVILENSEKQAI